MMKKTFGLATWTMLLVLAIFGTTSCTQDLEIGGDLPDGDASMIEVELKLQLEKVGDVNIPTTRSTYLSTTDARRSVAAENLVEAVILAVYDKNDKFSYFATGQLNADELKVKTKLKRSSNATDTYQIAVIANRPISDEEKAAHFIVGTSTLNDLASLTFDASGLWMSLPDQGTGMVPDPGNAGKFVKVIPLLGVSANLEVTASMTMPTINLLRAMARVDIGFDFSSTTNGSETVTLPATARLYEVWVYNAPLKGSVANNALMTQNATGTIVTSATVPTSPTTTYDEVGWQTLHDYGTPTPASYQPMSVRECYIAEKSNSSTQTFLVIGVMDMADSGTPSYYRINFSETNATDILPILRNKRYVFSITSITGKGWATKEAAAASHPQNIEWNLTYTEKGGIFVSGANTITLDRTSIALPGNTPEERTLGYILSSGFTPDPIPFTFVWGTPTNGVVGVVDLANYINVSYVVESSTTGHFKFTITQSNNWPKWTRYTQRLYVNCNGPNPGITDNTIAIDVTMVAEQTAYDIFNVDIHGIYLPRKLTNENFIANEHYAELTLRSLYADDVRTNKTFNIESDAVSGGGYTASFATPGDVSFSNTSVTYNGRGNADGTPNSSGFYEFFTYKIPLKAGSSVLEDWRGDYDIYFHGDGVATEDRVTPTEAFAHWFVGYKTKNVLGYGLYQGTYGYHAEAGASRIMLRSPRVFGLNANSMVPVSGIIYKSIASQGSKIEDGGHPVLTAIAGANKPDILIFGHYVTLLPVAVTALRDYINNGGVVLMFQREDVAGTKSLMESIGAGSSMTFAYESAAPGHIYPFVTDGGVSGTGGESVAAGNLDFIAHGIFTGERMVSSTSPAALPKGWGENSVGTRFVTDGLSSAQVVVYTRETNLAGRVTSFRHKTKGFLWVGDGGFLSGRNRSNTYSTSQPFCVNLDGSPYAKPSYGTPPGTVYNSSYFAGIMGWAIDYAEFLGINNPNRVSNASTYGSATWHRPN
ncbi:MAG: hypothetical protein LBS52_03430 [Dysgonamonadaceae bacterium]|jgi:hypothetical protein|nr:hypothetical protein [Dysgonamonadaceae bacterium]